MGIDFTVFKGSPSGEIIEAKGHREVGPTQALVELSHCGVCGVSSLEELSVSGINGFVESPVGAHVKETCNS